MEGNLDLVKLRVTANVIIDWCKEKLSQKLISYNSSFVSSYKKFRFTTPIIEKIFLCKKAKSVSYNYNSFIYYEIENVEGNISLSLLVSSKEIKGKDRFNSFLKSNKVDDTGDEIVVKIWNVFTKYNQLENLAGALDNLFFGELKRYEGEVSKWLDDNHYVIYDSDYDLVEGAILNISTNMYERNKEARKKCIEYHGVKCKICGFDFGEVYGDDLKGKIQVHHKKPLSEIKEEYVVDPINDLIPVCPNCHMVIHSKKEGVYTADEVIALLNQYKIDKSVE